MAVFINPKTSRFKLTVYEVRAALLKCNLAEML